MKKNLIYFLFINICFTENEDIVNILEWDTSVSYGFLSEKNPVSIIEFSGLYNFDKQSENYVSIGSMLFASGIGCGYKYYFQSKYTNSLFISFGTFLSHLGTADDTGMTIYGFSFSTGYSIIKRDKLFLGKKNAINIGLSLMHMGDSSIGAFPYINIEKRF